MFSAYQRHQVGVNSSTPCLPWISGGGKNTWQWCGPLPTCSQAASFAALPVFKKSQDQKKWARTYRAEYNLLLSTYFILMGSSQRQQLPAGNVLFDLSGQWLPKAPELYIHAWYPSFYFSHLSREKVCSCLSTEQGDWISCLLLCLFFLKQPTDPTG